MAVSGLGKITAKAAGAAAGAVGDIMGAGVYPESEYALAAYLFERIAQAEKDGAGEPVAERDRAYHLDLMATCLATVRGPGPEA